MKTNHTINISSTSKFFFLLLLVLCPLILSAQTPKISGAKYPNVGDTKIYTVDASLSSSYISWFVSSGGSNLVKTSTSLTLDWTTIGSHTVYYTYSVGANEITLQFPVTVGNTTVIPTPTLSIVAQPTCPDTDGTFTIVNYNDDYTYSASPSTDVDITGDKVTAPPGGPYTIKATLGLNSSAYSVGKTVNEPIKPEEPELLVVTQPSCSDPNVTFKIDNFNDYTSDHSFEISPSGATRDGATITGPAAAYIVRAKTSTNSASARAVPESDCTSGWSDPIDVNDPPSAVTAGSINTTTQTVCYNSDANNIVSTSAAGGGDDEYEYTWMYSSSKDGTYLEIADSDSASFNPSTDLTSDRWYKRKVSSCNTEALTLPVKIDVKSALTAGVITAPSSVCYNGNPNAITSNSGESNGIGGYTYEWFSSTSQNGTYSEISNSDVESYDPPTLTSSRWYQRKVSSCGQDAYSNKIQIVVGPALTSGGSIGAPDAVCYNGNPDAITNDGDPVGGGSYTYKWYSSTSENGTYGGINNSDVESYDPPTLTASRWYQRKVSSCNQDAYSNKIQIVVGPALTSGGSIGAPDAVCYNGNPDAITNDGDPVGGGSYTYKWYSSTSENGTYGGINNSDVESYDPPTLTASRWYQRKVSSCNQDAYSNKIQIVVTPQLDAPTITNDEVSFCGTGTVVITMTKDTDATAARWYTSSYGGNHFHEGDTYNAPAQNETYYVSSFSDTNNIECESATRKAVTVTLTGTMIWSLDADNDDFAVNRQESCNSPGTGWRALDLPLGDCDDANANITIAKIWYADYEGDGLGNPNAPTELLCEAPANHVANNTDLCPNKSTSSNDCFTQPSECNSTGGVLSGHWSKNNYVYSRTYQNEVDNIPSSKFAADNNYIQSITYFDGLGRPIQQNDIRQSPSENDIVTHIEYDSFGRMYKDWLPFHEDQQAMGRFKTGDLATATKSYYRDNYGDDFEGMDLGEHNPYSEKSFEASPLNRVVQQAAPGKDWKLNNGHEIELDYQVNTSADGVKHYDVTLALADNTYNPTIKAKPNYTAGELSKNVTKDENHEAADDKLHTTEEFSDKQGRMVLKRTYALVANSQEAHDTYYVYDDYGNLTFVLPPKMNGGITNMDELGYQYVYDYRNRLVEKQIPGKGREYIVYNKLDQPILTQDANQREKNASSDEWLFTQYDAFGRVAYTGKATTSDGTPRTAIQSEVSNLDTQLWVNQTSSSIAKGATNKTTAVYYSDAGYPNASSSATLDEILTINYFDAYVDIAEAPLTFTPLGGAQETNGASINTKDLSTVSKVKILDVAGPNNWITSVNYYDAKGRPIYAYSQNDFLGTSDVMETELDFVGKPLKTRTTHKRGIDTIVTIDNFAYDHSGRLIAQTQCIGDGTLGTSCGTGAITNTIDSVLEINNETVTNERVASTSISVTNVTLSTGAHLYISADAIDNGDQELIAFNEYDNLGQLKYKKVGGTPHFSDFNNSNELQKIDYKYNVRGWLTDINDVTNATTDELFNFSIGYNQGANPLFNGNISQTQWRTDNTDSSLKSYDYAYDALNRITAASWGAENNNYDVSNITYDKMGNIQSLNRNGFQNSSDFTDMDVLNYDYDSGNKLSNVADAGNDAYGFKDVDNAIDFEYDINGNMTIDRNKGITSIIYNHLNLPKEVTVTGSDAGTISFIYNANGVKLQKNVLKNGETEPTHTDYAGNYIYENNKLQFFIHGEGYTEPRNPDNLSQGYDYIYQFKDNLGNIRLSYKDVSTTSTPSLKIQEENNYYLFGLKHKGYNGNQSAARDHKFEYNGVEFEQSLGLNLMEMNFRQYDPAIGRFTAIDPVTHFNQSTFTAFDNNPAYWADPSGTNSVNSIQGAWDATSSNGSSSWNSNGNGGFCDDCHEEGISKMTIMNAQYQKKGKVTFQVQKQYYHNGGLGVFKSGWYGEKQYFELWRETINAVAQGRGSIEVFNNYDIDDDVNFVLDTWLAKAYGRYGGEVPTPFAHTGRITPLSFLDIIPSKLILKARSLLNASKLTKASILKKLNGYSLNPNHAIGKHKARVFSSTLGFTQNNAGILAKQINFNNKLARKVGVNNYGVKYEQIISVKGVNGNIAKVTTGWIRKHNGDLNLTSAYITK